MFIQYFLTKVLNLNDLKINLVLLLKINKLQLSGILLLIPYEPEYMGLT